ncbi:MAG: gliding motility-associated C-terminal domain-containing protein [Bacteroidales bacterium]|jgi:gliding motility-associated-like protein|nr:gliding motility-associated C-terminal domain-containing protein [Bacteroidales bacterium]
MKWTVCLRFNLVLLLLLNATVSVSAANYNMSTAPVTIATGDTCCDPQGNSNYSNNQDITQVMNACDANSVIVLYFSTLNLGSGDTLWIYDGAATSAPLLVMLEGTPASSITVMSSGTVLCLRFKADAADNAPGWEAAIKCVNINISTASTAFGSPCHNGPGQLAPFCTDENPYGITYQNSSGDVSNASVYLGTYGIGCLNSTPNPAWYYMKINDPGDLLIYIEQYNTNNMPIDVDFICWGPFICASQQNFAAAICAQAFTLSNCFCGSHRPAGGNHNGDMGGYPVNNVIDCSYYTTSTEWCYIPDVQHGEFYLLLITNFSRVPGTISYSLVYPASTANTDCSILAAITSNSPVCADTLQLTCQNPQTGAVYQWWGPNGWSSTVQNPVINNATPAMSGTYYMLKTLNGQVSDAASVEVVIGVADSIYFEDAICLGSRYTDNGFDETPAAAGTFNFTRTLQNYAGCDSTVFLTLTVFESYHLVIRDTCCAGSVYSNHGFTLPVPAAGIYIDTLSFTTAYGCDSIIILILMANDAYNITISDTCCMGGAYIRYGFTVPIPAAGTYTDTLSLTTAYGCDSIITLTLRVNDTYQIAINDTCCVGGAYTRYGFTVPIPAAGIYADTLNLATAYGCDSIITLTLKVNDTYHITVTDTCCAGGAYTRNGFSFPVPVAGHYREILNLTTAAGCDSTVTLLLSAGASPIISAVVDENPCTANVSSISLSFTGGLSPYYCVWNNGATTPAITQLPYGTYTALVTDSVNCKTNYSATLTASDFQAVASTVFSYCNEANGSAVVHASGGSGSYALVPGESTAAPVSFLCDDFVFDQLPAGSYRVAVTDSICTLNVAFTITNLGNPQAGFYTRYDAYKAREPVLFINSSRYATSYYWDFGDGNSSTEENPIYFYDDFGQYMVTVFATDDYDCVDSFSNEVRLQDLASCYFPNTFTPNGDGYNETFGPVCHNIQMEDYLFVIYDRWSNKVFESHDIGSQWNGTINGKEAMPAVYVWHLLYRNERHKLQERKGFVTIVR